eukprot:gnl/Chilomastix_caulleri/187.p1 GENE.gnl/Chilomastix_caulleri/187~~gnl/Chilomastix_caulleri/187.p1  ORF type:complete len:191 (-),score=26.10 gnl/Chilomastix_caulleri/187:304-876(-)
MCCCCKCCNKILKIVCSIIWILVAIALIAVIIIFAIAWGGSKVMQDVMTNLIKCGINPDPNSTCNQTFGAYIEGISDFTNLRCLDVASTNAEGDFGWIIDFNIIDKGLGVYTRLSSKGIDQGKENIFSIKGTLQDMSLVHLNVPVYTLDENGAPISDKKNNISSTIVICVFMPLVIVYLVHAQYQWIKSM